MRPFTDGVERPRALAWVSVCVLLTWAGESSARARSGRAAKKVPKSEQKDIVAESWRSPALAKEDLVGFMRLSFESTLKELQPQKAARLRTDLERLTGRSVSERVSYGTHASAMLEALGFHYEARAYAAWTVLQNPDSTVALANESALSCYPPALRLAAEVAPKSPVVHTNMGSCAMAARQWDTAKAAYEKALELDPKHRNALIGLGRWYFRIPDPKTAFDYFIKANGVHLQPQLERRDQKGKVFPPPEPIEPKDNRFGGGSSRGGEPNGGTARLTDTKMSLPPLPFWSTPNAFLASGRKRKALMTFYSEKVGRIIRDGVKQLESRPLDKIRKLREEVAAMSPAQRDELGIRQALSPAWDDSAVMRAITLNYAWAEKRLAAADAEYEDSIAREKDVQRKLDDLMKTRSALQDSGCRGGESMAAAKECIERSRHAATTTCKALMPVVHQSFQIWRDAYQKWYHNAAPVLEELYRVQGLWLRQIANKEVWRSQAMARNAVVFAPLMGKMMEESFRRTAVVAMYAGAFGSRDGRCPDDPPPKQEEPEDPTIPDTADPESDCPIPPGKPWRIPPFSIPGIKLPFSAKLSCTEVEVSVKVGYTSGGDEDSNIAEAAGVLSVTHRFGSDQSTTVFVGAEAGLSFGVPVATVGVGAEAGVAFTFDKQGQLQDYGLRGGINETASLPLDLASASASATAVLEKGAPFNIERGGEASSVLDPFTQ